MAPPPSSLPPAPPPSYLDDPAARRRYALRRAAALAVLGALVQVLVWALAELGEGWGAFLDLFRGRRAPPGLTDALAPLVLL